MYISSNFQHPDRWDEAYACRTANRGKNVLTTKEVLLQKCDEWCNDHGDQVRIRLNSKVGDLHAMDAR